MLEFYFKNPTTLRRLRRGALRDRIDGFATALAQAGFTRNTARRMLCLAGQLSRYAAMARIDASAIDQRLADRFVRDELRPCGPFAQAGTFLRHLLCFLRGEAFVLRVGRQRSPIQPLVVEYDLYLRDVAGLTESTRRTALEDARSLLRALPSGPSRVHLRHLKGPVVLGYLVRRFRTLTLSRCSGLCTHTRRFLRYLIAKGFVRDDLSRVVPSVPGAPALSSVPKHLDWSAVLRLIDSVDETSAHGLRDKAMLSLLGLLGLRSHEARAVQMDDIRWHRSELVVRSAKSGRERVLPLPAAVAAALRHYLARERPKVKSPFVFLRARAPVGPLASSSAIKNIVTARLRTSGITAPSGGGHMLRHSLATHLVNRGVSMKAIADILGHSRLSTTAIYAKVDMSTLSDVPMPFPGAAQ